jgi:16S rRNA (cytosine967-C5)-methyltransferase
MNCRRLALDLLTRWEAGEEYINLTIGHACETLSDPDRRYLTALLYGTVERRITLDYEIGKLSGRSSLDPTTRNILRLGLYELLYMHTPAHAAVNETVALTRNRGEAGFVNGILRTALRSPELLTPPPKEKNLARHYSVKYSLPAQTVRLLLAVLGEQTEDFLAAINAPHGMTLRVNTMRIGREAYLLRLSEAGIAAAPTPYAPFGVVLDRSYPPRELPGFDEGLFYVQDEASQIAVAALSPTPGSLVLDLCACPGGKSFGCAMTMGDTGEVRAFDLHASKLSLITEGAARLGLTCLRVAEQDSASPDRALLGQGDFVLCDVPCSGLGVLSKKADLRYKDPSVALRLPELQLRLLEAGATCLKEDGTLLYSTCTVNPAENEGVTDAFLRDHPAFTYVPFSVGALSCEAGHMTLYPHLHHTDGFYIAKLKRRHP